MENNCTRWEITLKIFQMLLAYSCTFSMVFYVPFACTLRYDKRTKIFCEIKNESNIFGDVGRGFQKVFKIQNKKIKIKNLPTNII